MLATENSLQTKLETYRYYKNLRYTLITSSAKTHRKSLKSTLGKLFRMGTYRQLLVQFRGHLPATTKVFELG